MDQDEGVVKITKEQALAFIDSLVGWEDFSDEHGRPKSPHALTHLECVLGFGAVTMDEVMRLVNSNDYYNRLLTSHGQERLKRVEKLADYLRAVADAISPKGGQA